MARACHLIELTLNGDRIGSICAAHASDAESSFAARTASATCFDLHRPINEQPQSVVIW